MLKVVERIALVIMIALLVWWGVSYMEIILHNLDENPIYSSWNFFQILVNKTM